MLMDGVIVSPTYPTTRASADLQCMPICVAGFFFIPDVPGNINPRLNWYFNDRDREIIQARTDSWKRAPTKKLNLQSIKAVYTTWIPVSLVQCTSQVR